MSGISSYSSGNYIAAPSFGYRSEIKKVAKHCAYCLKEFGKNLPATAEHIHPYSKGGINNIKNYFAACQSCNSKRGNIDFKLWIERYPKILENIKIYMKELKGKTIGGVNYNKEISKTVSQELGYTVSFTSNKARRINIVG